MWKEPRKLSELPVELSQIPVKEINDAGRGRKEYRDIEALRLSIVEKGLIHPIVVKRYKTPLEKYNYFLLAGGRRLVAIQSLGWEEVSARIYPHDLNGYEIRAIELEENLRREDLTDAERILMIKQVHDLYTDLYGEKTSTAPGAEGHSARDTAKMLGVSPAKISTDLEIAKWLQEIPELAALGTRKEIRQAISMAKKKVNRVQVLKAAGIEEKVITDDTLEKAYKVGDAFKLCKGVPDGSVDLVDLDIDYPMDIEDNILYNSIKLDKALGDYTTVSREEYPTLMKKALEESYRMLDKGGWCLTWCGMEYYERLRQWAVEVGFVPTLYFGKWYKTDGFSHCRTPLNVLKHSMETFFYFRKDSGQLQKAHSDVFACPPRPSKRRAHPYEKPAELMFEIFDVFIAEGSSIKVFFAGGGGSLIAGHKHKCSIEGWDTSEEYYKGFLLDVRERRMKGVL